MPDPVPDTDTQTEIPRKSLLATLAHLLSKLFDGITRLTEKVIGILRLLAISTLFLVVLFVIYRAIQSSGVIDVKPFSVPKSMLDKNAEAGRIVSNMLKSALRQEESNYILSINGIIPSRENVDSSIAGQQLTAGGDIKIPQTGISINDVVEFISSIFGKQSISGTVYEDSEKLYLQLVLKGRVFSFETALVEGKSRIALLEEMLQQHSSKKILSVAFENYNLYYYCNGEINSIEWHKGKYKKWFNYCQQSRELDSEEKILALKKQLSAYDQKTVLKEDKLAIHCLTQVTHLIDNKLQLIRQSKSLLARTNSVNTAMLGPRKKSYKPESTPPDDFGSLSAKAPSLTEKLKASCEEPANPSKSSRKEADATLLYKLELYEDAIQKYHDAIQADCHNAKAWANLGVLYTSANDNRFQDTEKAVALLTEAATLNPQAGWIQHQLCIAETYFNGTGMDIESALNKKSCQQARLLEPANAVLYDKLFYLALADRYFKKGNAKEALPLYIKSMEIDKRADCHLYEVITRLKKNYSDGDDKTRAEQASCRVLKQAYFIKEQTDGCHDDLKQLKSQCL